MGDELVLDVFTALLAESLKRHMTPATTSSAGAAVRVSLDSQQGGILQVDARGMRRVKKPSFEYRDFDFAVLGGGSLLEPVDTYWGPFCQSVRWARRPLYIHATGTQIMVNRTVRTSTQSLRCIQKPVYGGLRGPITAQLIRDLATSWSRSNPRVDARRRFNLELPIISDSGILTAHIFPRHVASIVEFVDQYRSPNGVVCISGFPQGLDAAGLVRSWAGKYTVVLMPVDHMNLARVLDMHKKLLRQESSLSNRVFVNQFLTNYGVWLALLDRCNIMLTSRLHAMIVAASAQRPFRIFDESRKSQLKMLDFVSNTFGEGLEPFKLPRGWAGSLPELDAVLSSQDMAAWKARYNESYAARAIVKPYEAHMDAVGKFLRDLMRPTGFTGLTEARVSVQRHFDRATIQISFR